MRIGVIQASSQAGKHALLLEAAGEAAPGHEVIGFGCDGSEPERYSYLETALAAGLLLLRGSVDLIVTGCSSGQGMMLAMNSIPGVLCGYTPSPRDAYLFAQINDGNAVSLPLGEEYVWYGEENLRRTLNALFSEPFGQGWPREDAERKLRDTRLLKRIRQSGQIDPELFYARLDARLLTKAEALIRGRNG